MWASVFLWVCVCVLERFSRRKTQTFLPSELHELFLGLLVSAEQAGNSNYRVNIVKVVVANTLAYRCPFTHPADMQHLFVSTKFTLFQLCFWSPPLKSFTFSSSLTVRRVIGALLMKAAPTEPDRKWDVKPKLRSKRCIKSWVERNWRVCWVFTLTHICLICLYWLKQLQLKLSLHVIYSIYFCLYK